MGGGTKVVLARRGLTGLPELFSRHFVLARTYFWREECRERANMRKVFGDDGNDLNGDLRRSYYGIVSPPSRFYVCWDVYFGTVVRNKKT